MASNGLFYNKRWLNMVHSPAKNLSLLLAASCVYTAFIYFGYSFFYISVMLTSIPLCGLATWLFNFRIGILAMALITLLNLLMMMHHVNGFEGWRLAIEPGGLAMQFCAIIFVAKIQGNYRKSKELTESLEIQIRERNKELHEIAEYIISESETERSRMSESLCMLAEKQQKELLRHSIELNNQLIQRGAAQAKATTKLVKLARENVEQMESLRDRLSPQRVAAKGIGPALKEVCDHYRESKEVEFKISFSDHLDDLPDEISVNLYRIAYEGITNALRHGKAENIVLTINRTDTHCMLEVINDGIPLPENPVKGLGTRLIQHRADTIHAEASLKTATDGRTRLICNVPLQSPSTDYSGLDDNTVH